MEAQGSAEDILKKFPTIRREADYRSVENKMRAAHAASINARNDANALQQLHQQLLYLGRWREAAEEGQKYLIAVQEYMDRAREAAIDAWRLRNARVRD